MKNLSTGNFRNNLAAASVAVAPIMLLAGDLIGFAPDLYYAHYALAKAALAMFVFAIFALVELLRRDADKLGLIGGGMAIIGAISGTTLFSFGYFYNEVSRSGLDASTAQSVEQIFRQVYGVMVFVPLPGLFFPIGLIILSIGLFWTKVVPHWTAIALGLGALLFPVGRIPGILTVSVISDIFLTLSMCFIGWQILARSNFLQQNENLVEAAANVRV